MIEFGDCYNCYCSVRQQDQQYERPNNNDLLPSVRTQQNRTNR